jgi:hypothetical protein
MVRTNNGLPWMANVDNQRQDFGSAVCVVMTVAAALLVWPCNSTAQDRARQPVAFGRKIADGQAYVTLVRLEHQSDPAENGRILIAFEENGMEGIPIFESKDDGAAWQFLVHATDSVHTDRRQCNLHWQPHLTEVARDGGSLQAGTVLLSASAVCNGDNGRVKDQHLQLYGSTDGGRTWQFRSTIAEGTTELPVWEPHLQILDSGTLVTYYSSEVHKDGGYNQLLCHKISSDEGKT